MGSASETSRGEASHERIQAPDKKMREVEHLVADWLPLSCRYVDGHQTGWVGVAAHGERKRLVVHELVKTLIDAHEIREPEPLFINYWPPQF